MPAAGVGERLPMRYYSIAEGLASTEVRKVFQDSRGFLWFGTREGLSLFDSYEFENFGVRDGLPNPVINDIAEDPYGRIWVAANDGGIALLTDPNAHLKQFQRIWVDPDSNAANKVNRILIDSRGKIWCLTDDGLFRSSLDSPEKFELIKKYDQPIMGEASNLLFEAGDGAVWFAVETRLYQFRNGNIAEDASFTGPGNFFIVDGKQLRDGRIVLLEFRRGLFEYRPSETWKNIYTAGPDLDDFFALLEEKDGTLWVGGRDGLIRFKGPETTKYYSLTELGGLRIRALGTDDEGNIWVGSTFSGAIRLPETSVATYPVPVGTYSLGMEVLPSGALSAIYCKPISSLWDCRAVKQKIGTNGSKEESLKTIPAFAKQLVLYPDGNGGLGIELGPYRRMLIDDTSIRFKNGAKFDLQQLFLRVPDGQKRMWVAIDGDTLWAFLADGTLKKVVSADGKITVETVMKTEGRYGSLITDRTGNLWMYNRGGSFGRIRDGKWEVLRLFGGETEIDPSAAFFDKRGRAWFGTYFTGIFVCEDPTAVQPKCEPVELPESIAGTMINSISEDPDGRIYIGTSKGMVRLDPETGASRLFTSRDGLASEMVTGFANDASGNMWVNTISGLTRLERGPERPVQPPRAYISKINIGGETHSAGETLDLASDQHTLTIDYIGLSYSNENALRYQYLLQGAGNDWSEPGKTRSITLGALAPGSYRFKVRAINDAGIVSQVPAEFAFVIAPPFYLRWWFVAASVLAAAAIIYLFYRLRWQRVLAVERTRTMIATDLHDDIGSNLSKISVLSEVSRLRSESGKRPDPTLLRSIAGIARDSVSSMSDIVWAIDPKRDSAEDLLFKMREYAEDLCSAKGIQLDFISSKGFEKANLKMERRRDIYLIFKESMNNLARHSGCSAAIVEIEDGGGLITLRISDNGTGFDPETASSGNGSLNIRQRAQRSGGRVAVESSPGTGTTVVAVLPH